MKPSPTLARRPSCSASTAARVGRINQHPLQIGYRSVVEHLRPDHQQPLARLTEVKPCVGDPVRRGGARPVLEDCRQLGANALQSRDGGARLGVDRAECAGGARAQEPIDSIWRSGKPRLLRRVLCRRRRCRTSHCLQPFAGRSLSSSNPSWW